MTGRNYDTVSAPVPKAVMFNLVRDVYKFGKIWTACDNIHFDKRNAD
jgi:hypothetical protein